LAKDKKADRTKARRAIVGVISKLDPTSDFSQ
jgi:hypothetical protein